MRKVGHTLCDLDSLLKRSGGKPVTTYSSFTTLLEKETRANPIRALPAPTQLPPASDVSESELNLIPTIEELGYDVSDSCVMIRGGESAALKRMEVRTAHRNDFQLTRQRMVTAG